jgi:hypothetical protein
MTVYVYMWGNTSKERGTNPILICQLTTELKVHKLAKYVYNKLKEATELAKSSEDTEVIYFDFKQNMPFPQLPTSDIFYCHQMWLYVMS